MFVPNWWMCKYLCINLKKHDTVCQHRAYISFSLPPSGQKHVIAGLKIAHDFKHLKRKFICLLVKERVVERIMRHLYCHVS